MTRVASRELRNDTAALLSRVQAGEVVVVTVHGRDVARLVPVSGRREWLTPTELSQRLRRLQADPGLRDDLAALAGDNTDDLGPIR